MVGNRPIYTHMLGSKYNQIVVELNTYFCLGQQATVIKKQNSTSEIICYDYHLMGVTLIQDLSLQQMKSSG